MMPPKSDGILESSLYVSDVARSARFYEETFGFRVIKEFGERGCAMHAGTHQVLLLFEKGASRTIQSPHDGDGELHIAFAIPADELASWESWLQTRGIAVEEKKGVGAGRMEPLLQRPRPALARTGDAGRLVRVLK
jgi:catechol 2,3-dioxygenase-like lactoylglutathione lyase family enzyme